MYTLDGEQVDLIQKLDDGRFLVDPYIEHYSDWEEGPEYLPSGRLCIVDQVFKTAPSAVVDEHVAAAKLLLEKLTEKLKGIRQEIREVRQEAENQEGEIKTKLDQYEAVRHVFDFIDGKITHYVIAERWALPKVVSLDEASNTMYEQGSHGEKLLVLFGKSNGDLQWNINRYKDDSGSWNHVYPFTSEEKALEHLRGLIIERLAKSPSLELIALADKNNVPVSAEMRDEAKNAKLAKLKESVGKRKAELKEAQDRLAKAA